jgi:diacylglycerol kinase (ATP)
MKPAGRSAPDGNQAHLPGRPLIIVNPKAGAGRALRSAQTLAQRLAQTSYPADVTLTESPGHATLVARQARAAGVGSVVAVGGDGTVQEVVTGLCLEADGTAVRPEAPRPALGLLPAGTGGDYRRTFGWTDSVDEALSRICSPHPVQVDVGRAEVTTPGGGVTSLAFANVLSFGLGGLTDQLVARSPKWIGGTAAFYLGAVRATFVYQALPVELVIDGTAIAVLPYANVAVCLGKYFGGGMKIAPGADPSDGTFEIVTITGSRASVLALTADIYRGTHLRRPGVTLLRGKSVVARVTRPGEVLVDADGEQPGTLPISIELLPRALTLLA